MQEDEIDFEWFEEEVNSDLLEINRIRNDIDEGKEWLDLFTDLYCFLEDFNFNMESLHSGIKTLQIESASSTFLNGIILVGVVSAYESFVHQLLDVCCNKKNYIEKALKNIDCLDKNDKNHLRLKSGITDTDFIKKLKRATLHDPIQIARISKCLFDLEMPSLENEYTKELLEYRNLFTHNGGLIDGKRKEISSVYLLSAHDKVYELINGYVDALKKEVDKLIKT